MPRRRLYPEFVAARFPAGTFARLVACRQPEETNIQMILRRVVEEWLTRAEKRKEKP